MSVGKRGIVCALVGATALGLGACGQVPIWTTPLNPVEQHAFDTPLAIPPLADSRVEDGVRVFDLTAQDGDSDFAPATDGTRTPTRGFNGDFLGPTLRAERGERVAVEIDNHLDEATSVHWHGMHLPAMMDGGPHQEIPAGGSWRPEWEIDQPASTLWYHPHPHGATEHHVYSGLAGMSILDDDASQAADLPDEYGVDDIPVIVQDRAFNDDGTFRLDHDGAEPGQLGDTILTNGTVGAYQEVTTERVRLRLLNGSTARTYQFSVPGKRPVMVAGDGGLLDRPVPVDGSLRLSPGECAEILVDVEPGDVARLRSEEVDLGGVAVSGVMGGGDAFDVLELRAAAELTPSPGDSAAEVGWPASEHAEEDELHESDASRTRSFKLSGREINGRRMDMTRIDEVVHVGDTEIWEVRNLEPIPHSFHVHDLQFRILTVDGDAPPPELAGRKDTVYLEPNRDYRLLMRFDDHTDPDHAYMYHCHMLLHEDEGMMGQFVVIGPDEEAPDRLPAPGAGPHNSHGGH